MMMIDSDWQELENYNQQQSYRASLIGDDRSITEAEFRKVVDKATSQFGDKHVLNTLVDIVIKREKNTMKLYDLWTELEREAEDRRIPNLSAW